MGAYEVVKKLEAMRKRKIVYGILMIACIVCPIPVMIFYPLMGLGDMTPIICMAIMVVGIFFFTGQSGKIQKDYKKIYKENFVVSVLNEVFDNVKYDYKKGFNSAYVRTFGLTRLGNKFESEDYLRASYKGINFEQADVVISYHTSHSSNKNSHTTTYFKGRMFAFDFPFKSVSSVQVFTENYPYRGTPTINEKLNKIEMESDLFNKRFDVLALDDEEAFYVLTPQMMEKIESIRDKYNHVAMHFSGNKLYVGIWTSDNAFDGNPKRKIDYLEEKEATLRDAHVITGIIDALGIMKPEDSDNVMAQNQIPSKTNDDYDANSPEEQLAAILSGAGLGGDDLSKIMSVSKGISGAASSRAGFKFKL